MQKLKQAGTILMVCLVVCVFISLVGCMPFGETEIYPSPGNLNEIEGLQESEVFDLIINGRNAFVYHAREINQPRMSGVGVNYCNFEFEGEVKVSLIAHRQIISWSVLPLMEGVRKIGTNTIQFRLDAPVKRVFIVEMQDVGEQYFILSAEGPETEYPDPSDPTVLFLKPGIHPFGQSWDPFVDGIKTLYVSGGAVLEATLKSVDKAGVSIRGRGLIHQAFVPHAKEAGMQKEWDADWMGIYFRDCLNVAVEGVAVTCSPGYQLEFANCDSVVVRNVKLCGFGENNNDGLHTYSRDVLVEDCLIASNDDRICVTGLYDIDNTTDGPEWDGTYELTACPVENVMVRNVILWGLNNNGADIMLTWNGGYHARNYIVQNCFSLSPTNKAFVAAMHGGSAVIHDIFFKDCRLYHGHLFDIRMKEFMIQGQGGGKIFDLYMENIIIDAEPGEVKKQLLGISEQSSITRFTLKNIRANGRRITGLDQTAIETNAFVKNINFVE